MTPAEHRAAAEQALTDAWDDNTTRTLLRALTHAVLALSHENPHPPPADAPSPHAEPQPHTPKENHDAHPQHQT